MATAQDQTANGKGGLIYYKFLQFNGLATICLCLIYYFWKLPFWLGPSIFISINTILGLRYRKSFADFILRLFKPDDSTGLIYGAAAVIVDILLLLIFFLHRTDLPLTSPWQILSPAVFVLFALACAFVLMAFRNLKQETAYILAVFHTTTAFSLIMTIYSLGFGYDSFVHEATMNYIRKFGSISPKQLFYIGEYVLVLPLRQILNLPLNFIQQAFLPLLAGFMLPTALYFSNQKKQYWIIWLMLYAPFTFTVPYNLALLWCALAFVIMSSKKPRSAETAFVLSVCSLFTHPLVGIPAVCATLVNLLSRRLKPSWLFSVSFVAVASSLLLALFVYTKQNGGHVLVPTLSTLFDSARIILRSPANFSLQHPFWSMLYIFYAFWPYALILVGILGLLQSNLRNNISIFLGVFVGVLVSAILAATSFRYNNIISHEQYEFSYRLISLLPWILFPGLLFFGKKLEDYFINKSYPLFAILIACLALSIWYVSYPQYNPAMPYYAPSPSRAELQTAEWIESQLGNQTYAALAPQLVSAGALRTIGFEKHLNAADGSTYPFAIPTGGVLYRIYLDFLTGQNMSGSLKEAIKYSNTENLAVTIQKSWDPYGVLADFLSKLAWKQYGVDDLDTFLIKSDLIQKQ